MKKGKIGVSERKKGIMNEKRFEEKKEGMRKGNKIMRKRKKGVRKGKNVRGKGKKV